MIKSKSEILVEIGKCLTKYNRWWTGTILSKYGTFEEYEKANMNHTNPKLQGRLDGLTYSSSHHVEKEIRRKTNQMENRALMLASIGHEEHFQAELEVYRWVLE